MPGTTSWFFALVLACAAAVAGVPYLMPPAEAPAAATAGSARSATADLPFAAVEARHGSAALASYIAGRWRIDVATARGYVLAARDAAHATAMDPLVLLAVIARESSFVHTGNPRAIGAPLDPALVNPLRPHGPMQVYGRWHPDKMPMDSNGNVRVTTREENVRIGAQVLAEYVHRSGGDLTRALQRYNGCSRGACEDYPKGVLRVREDLERVLGHA